MTYENNLGSKRLQLPAWQIERITDTSINPAIGAYDIARGDTIPYSHADEDYLIYERSISDLTGFRQLVIYSLKLNYDDLDSTYYVIKSIRNTFHSGEDHFGYRPVTPIYFYPDSFELTKVDQPDGAVFMSCYFSILKSFFNQMPVATEVHAGKHVLVDDYWGRDALRKEEMELEFEWMYSFLEKEYVYYDAEGWMVGNLIPNVHAPLRFYALDKTLGRRPKKYKLRVDDLTFELTWYFLDN